MSQYATGTYVKGSRRRLASTASEAVSAVFDGFKLASGADLSRSELQSLAKAANVPANLSNDDIRAELAKADSKLENPKAPEVGGDSPITGPEKS